MAKLAERIKSRKLLEMIFKGREAKVTTIFPIRALVLEVDHHANDDSLQVMFSVSKRHFKHAVKRNRVKRQLRETFRKHSYLVPAVAEGRELLIAFIWLADRLYATDELDGRMEKLLKKVRDARMEGDEPKGDENPVAEEKDGQDA